MVLAAEGERDARIARAEGEAKAILLAKQAEAEGIRLIREANPDAAVIELKKYDALVRMGDGKASKIIIPTDAVNAVTSNVLFSESTGLGDAHKERAREKGCTEEGRMLRTVRRPCKLIAENLFPGNNKKTGRLSFIQPSGFELSEYFGNIPMH